MNATRTTGALRAAIRRVLPQPQLRPAPLRYPRRYTFLDDGCTAREARHL
ncbi:hypothetical protein [[Mycobacterium] zoologicum]|nr:hypothetical protein [Mycolicibacter sp. MYC101]MEB3062018.1 hypothetical protein [Mycolicibacter sp. MYC101]